MNDRLPSDDAFERFLLETPADLARLDLASHMTDTELHHLARVRRTAA